MPRDILVLAEHKDGAVDGVTGEVLAKGRQLADALGEHLLALVMGHDAEQIASSLRRKGPDRILLVDDPALGTAAVEPQVHAAGEVLKRTEARLLLAGYTLKGMELVPAVGTRLGMPVLTNCVDVELLDGEVVVTRPLFDGTIHAKIALEAGQPAVIGLQQGSGLAEDVSQREAAIEPVTVDLSRIPAPTRVLGIISERETDVDIAQADIVVSVGRGIGGQENIRIVEELAQALGGVLACSRPIVDLGWLPRERQVGASGKSVTPKVYIACGISGASQHVAGITGAKRIIAINKDPDAPIFQVAHFGVVTNLFDIVSALTEEAHKSRASS